MKRKKNSSIDISMRKSIVDDIIVKLYHESLDETNNSLACLENYIDYYLFDVDGGNRFVEELLEKLLLIKLTVI